MSIFRKEIVCRWEFCHYVRTDKFGKVVEEGARTNDGVEARLIGNHPTGEGGGTRGERNSEMVRVRVPQVGIRGRAVSEKKGEKLPRGEEVARSQGRCGHRTQVGECG